MNFLNFWACKYILRKNASILMADMYNHGLAETAMCGNSVDSVEDSYHCTYFFFKCPKYESFKMSLFQAKIILYLALIINFT